MSHIFISLRFLKHPLCTLHLASPAPSFCCQSSKGLWAPSFPVTEFQSSPPGKNGHEAASGATEAEHPLGNQRGVNGWFGSTLRAGMDMLPEKLRRNPSLMYFPVFPNLFFNQFCHFPQKLNVDIAVGAWAESDGREKSTHILVPYSKQRSLKE